MRMQWSQRHAGGALALVLALGLGVAAERAASAQPPPAPAIKTVPCQALVSVEGKDSYVTYCAVCHGSDTKGNGPAAAALKMPIPDLTTLAQRQGGKYDGVAVKNVITGKGRVPPAHGVSTMPVWGPIFQSVDADQARASIRIHNLVNYIGSVQQTPAK